MFGLDNGNDGDGSERSEEGFNSLNDGARAMLISRQWHLLDLARMGHFTCKRRENTR